MTRPKTLYETASYDLNKFRERRMAERRLTPRDTADRRVSQIGNKTVQTRLNLLTTPDAANDPGAAND